MLWASLPNVVPAKLSYAAHVEILTRCESHRAEMAALRCARLVTARQSPDDLSAQRRAVPRHRRAWNRWFSSCRRPSSPLPDSRHSRDVLRRRPGHEVCGIGDSAIKTARIVLRTRTFEVPVPPAARNKLTFTMRYAAPRPPAGRDARARRPRQKSSLIFQHCRPSHAAQASAAARTSRCHKCPPRCSPSLMLAGVLARQRSRHKAEHTMVSSLAEPP